MWSWLFRCFFWKKYSGPLSNSLDRGGSQCAVDVATPLCVCCPFLWIHTPSSDIIFFSKGCQYYYLYVPGTFFEISISHVVYPKWIYTALVTSETIWFFHRVPAPSSPSFLPWSPKHSRWSPCHWPWRRHSGRGRERKTPAARGKRRQEEYRGKKFIKEEEKNKKKTKKHTNMKTKLKMQKM